MLYIINETTFNGYSVYNLDLLHIIAVLFGILVIISKNPIVSVLFLIGLFLAISGYLILTGLNFIGIAYLLVYIGAVSILFLFILMLINVRISELLIDSINSIPLAILLGSFFNYFVNNVLPYTVMTNSLFYNFSLKKKLTNVTSVSWDGYLAETSHITSIGNILYGNYSIWLIITSVILLLAMVGCIVITLKGKKVLQTPVLSPERCHFATLQLQSKVGVFIFLKKGFLIIKSFITILFSRDYVKYLSRKLFTKKSLCIVLSSIIIGNIVRYFAIKYGIHTPLLYHPILFSSATGISSFLSLASKFTIEMIFDTFDTFNTKLAMAVDNDVVIPKTSELDTHLKMNTTGSSSLGSPDPVPNNVELMHPLLGGAYVGRFRGLSTMKVFIPIDSPRLYKDDCFVYLAYLLDEYKDAHKLARESGYITKSASVGGLGIINHSDRVRIKELLLEVKPVAKADGLAVNDDLINRLWHRSP